jgi:transketolase
MEYGSKDDRICYVGVDTIDPAFAEEHAERVIDVGIAEQNEMSVAAGMAWAGMIPIVNAVTPFSPLRNFDQLRTVLARHNCNVKIIARSLGLQNISHGATHHDYESLALYLTIPNLIVLAPAEEWQMEAAFRAAMEVDGPVVIMGPSSTYDPGADGEMALELGERSFEIGKAEWLSEGTDVAIVSFGPALRYSVQAAKGLDDAGVSAGVLNMCSMKPFDDTAVLHAAKEYKAVLAVEEQTISGGLGAAVGTAIAEAGIGTRFKRLGIPDRYMEEIGDYTEMRAMIGLNAGGVAEAARGLLT